MLRIKQEMNDFQLIKNIISYEDEALNDIERKFTPEDAVSEFNACLDFFDENLVENSIVITHHVPTLQFIHPMYANNYHMNGGYASNLDGYIESHPEVKLWTCGHMHNGNDKVIGVTRVICNPRGYSGHEPSADSFKLKIVDL